MGNELPAQSSEEVRRAWEGGRQQLPATARARANTGAIDISDRVAWSGGGMAANAVVDSGRRPTEAGRDRISLTGITAFGHHGVFDFEREQGQRFVVDVSCTLDLSVSSEC